MHPSGLNIVRSLRVLFAPTEYSCVWAHEAILEGAVLQLHPCLDHPDRVGGQHHNRPCCKTCSEVMQGAQVVPAQPALCNSLRGSGRDDQEGIASRDLHVTRFVLSCYAQVKRSLQRVFDPPQDQHRNAGTVSRVENRATLPG